MLGFLVLARPQQGLMACRKHAACQVGRGVRFEPTDVVNQMPALLLKRKTAGVNGVVRPRYPQGAIGLQYATARRYPCRMKGEVRINAPARVPRAFVDAYPPSRMAGCAVV